MDTKVSISDQMVDITAPEYVEVLIRHDGKVVWVNVDNILRFRACRVVNLEINDERNGPIVTP